VRFLKMLNKNSRIEGYELTKAILAFSFKKTNEDHQILPLAEESSYHHSKANPSNTK